MDIIKVGILGVAAVLMAIPLRKEKQEYSMFLSMAVCICIFIYIITKVQIVLEFVEKLEGMIAIDSTYIGLVIKMVGITYAAEFAVNVCRDSGYGAIAGQIENFAKMSILVVSLPVLMAFIDTVGSRFMRKERWRWSVILFLMLAGLFCPVKVHAEETDSYLDGLSDEMDYGKLDTFLKDYGVELVSFSGLVEELMQDGVSTAWGEHVFSAIKTSLVGEIAANRKMLLEIVLLAFCFRF